MNVTKQLYQLQEVDLEIESNERTLKQLVSRLGESQTVVRTRTKLASEQERLNELKRQQQSAEWEIDDLVNKLTAAEEKLYSGKMKNPKELTNLQHEADGLKTRRSQLEDKTLETMNQVELATSSADTISRQLKKLEVEWRSQQQQLSIDIEQLKTTLSNLKQRQQLLSAEIEPQVIELYREIRKQKGIAVAKVEQGICQGCRISLPTTNLQRARSGRLAQCSSCGRILFLA